MRIAGVILSGGRSSRMGTDKSQLKIGDKTLLEHTKQLLIDSGITDTYVSGKNGIKDVYSDKGPISGIHATLNFLKPFDFIVFIPVDMPLLTKEVISELTTQQHFQDQHQILSFEGNNLPLIIKNDRNIRSVLENQIDKNELSIYKLLQNLDSKTIDNSYPKELFTNTNSPNQWKEAKRKLLK